MIFGCMNVKSLFIDMVAGGDGYTHCLQAKVLQARYPHQSQNLIKQEKMRTEKGDLGCLEHPLRLLL